MWRFKWVNDLCLINFILQLSDLGYKEYIECFSNDQFICFNFSINVHTPQCVWKGGWMGEDKTQFLDWLADQISNNLMMKRGLKWWSFQSKIYSKIFKNYFPKIKRLESNIELKSSNNSFFKIIQILNNFKIFEDHRIRKFRNFINLKKTRLFKWEKNKWMLLLCKQRRHAELIQLIYKAGAFTYFLLT